MVAVKFPIAAHKPAAMDAAFHAVGTAQALAVHDHAMREMLCVRFCDMFFWDAQAGQADYLTNLPPLIDFVARQRADCTDSELAMRPTQRFADLLLAVADLTGAAVEYSEGWPVILANGMERAA